jgi:hypothetical protein
MANPFTGGAAGFSGIDYLAPEVAQQQREIQRQQAIADLLRQQSLENNNQTQVVGGWAIPNSSAGRFSQLGQALMAGYMQRKIDGKQAAVAQQLAERLGGVSYAPASQSSSATAVTQPGTATTAPIVDGSVSAPPYDSRKVAAPGAAAGGVGPSLQSIMLYNAFGIAPPPKVVERLMGVEPNKEIVKVDAGNEVKVYAVDPVSGSQTLVTSLSKGVSPDAELGAGVTVRGQDKSAETTRRGQDIGSADQQRGQNMTAATTTRGQDMDFDAKARTLEAERLRNSPESKAAVATAEASAKATSDAARQLPGILETSQRSINLVNELVKSPDLDKLVGNTSGQLRKLIPGTTEADLQARINEIQGGAFLQAFESLKGAGQITEVEGAKATSALTRMSSNQSPAEFKKAANEYIEVIENAMKRAKQKAGATVEDLPPPPKRTASPSATGLTPQENAEMDRLRAQLKALEEERARLGGRQ